MPRGRAPLAVACLLLAGVGGCSRGEEPGLPPACREGADAVQRALRDAPGPVTIDGTPLSACLGEESDAGDLQQVGTAYLTTAGRLAAAAAEDPNGPEATQLGYLIGAVRRGARDADFGVNTEMVRRLEQEALRVDRSSPAYRRGLEAGRRGG